jgi:hypothetical protein
MLLFFFVGLCVVDLLLSIGFTNVQLRFLVASSSPMLSVLMVLLLLVLLVYTRIDPFDLFVDFLPYVALRFVAVFRFRTLQIDSFHYHNSQSDKIEVTHVQFQGKSNRNTVTGLQYRRLGTVLQYCCDVHNQCARREKS